MVKRLFSLCISLAAFSATAALRIGTNAPTKVYLGTQPVSNIRLGTQIVWSASHAPAAYYHWKMNDNAANTVVTDSQGRTNGIAARNTTNLFTTGKIGGAFTNNGSSDFVDLGTNFPVSQTFSIAFWLVNKGTDKTAYIWARNAAADTWASLGLSYGAHNLLIDSYDGALENYTVCSYGALTNGQHWVFVFNHPNLNVFRNGAPFSNIGFTRSFTNGYQKMTSIGRDGAYNNYYFDGTLDDFRYYTNALTTNQVSEIYNGGAGTEADDY